GAVCMDGNPVFFKEDAIIKVFGDHPSDFSVTEIQQRGIENGSSKSACFVNGDLYYRAHSGIVRYDGGVPQNVDRALGGEGESYKNAVAGSRGDLYYVSMEDKSGERVLFVYDTVRKTWHKEDTKSIKSFCRCGKDLYFLCEEKGESRVYSVLPKEGFEAESRVHWMCESGRLGYALQNKKYVSSVYLRLDCPVGSYADVLMEYDSDGVWHRKASVAGSEGSRLIRLRPHRCDHFRIRIEGEGRCSISSVARTLESCSGH
ncbi:MAG: hypothetical protein IJD22_04650, partial [Clostridia bacterium]|nr:hypothetical protein [Clostridia bacterium]